jgi:CDP-glucose 4,6-dehydratase
VALDPDEDQQLYNQLGGAARLTSDHHVDIRDGEALARIVVREAPSFIFHLAAQPLVRRSYDEPAETFATNVQGTVNVLEAVRRFDQPCVVVVATTDKCYENRGWLHAYREEDRLGGHDPYSASKACAELAASAYRSSFFDDCDRVRLATARAGNVIGGGDWSRDRIVPDCIRALRRGESIPVRNKSATRPWQHVLEPLSGYLWLAAALARPELVGATHAAPLCEPFNFGPTLAGDRTVGELVDELLKHSGGAWHDASSPEAVHEASRLNLAVDKAQHLLGWRPIWDFAETIRRTAEWYHADERGDDEVAISERQIADYHAAARAASAPWA